MGTKESAEGHRRDLQGPIIGTHLRLGKRVYPVLYIVDEEYHSVTALKSSTLVDLIAVHMVA